ncbi:hypothetical protein Purlil1_13986 [Purpureocillium lilacinum]|uniref:Arrestin n=1 Tax=Purpureocillium lilacinum TaxID=33203 RepID=A0ABR0BCK3_PURLI|nr:hypothetical protein Purlil1_13986 [Purpureocillium lilacinum]
MRPSHIAGPDTRRVGGIRRASAAQQKPVLDIEIERHFTSKVYTSGSAISGQAIVRTLQDTPFDSFDIIFAGVATTRLGSVQQYTSHSIHRFMKLCMPILQSSLPENKVFEAGKVYSIPFNFVVPHQLTLGACNHRCSNPAVREQHLRPPPTVGFWEADDQAPEMARIAYSIKARVYSRREAGCPLEGCHMVKVLPACPEDAPLDITIRDERYRLTKSKTIRKNLFTKAGKLTATASQPAAVMLGGDGHTASTTIVRVSLEFAPVSAVMAPPKINSISGKIAAVTFFSAAPADLLPNMGSRSVFTANPALSYTTTSPLFSNSVDRVAWQQHNFSGQRDSGYSSLRAGEDVHETEYPESRGCIGGNGKGSKKCPIRHSAVLEVPFSIPTSSRRLYLPTFYSCLISRTYTLRLNLSVGPTNTAMSLAIPLQIGVKAVHQPLFGPHQFSFDSPRVEFEEADVNAHVQPLRVLQIPEMGGQSNSLLPGYWG